MNIIDAISPGDLVTIRTPHGQEISGRAVMLGPHGWVISISGTRGQPRIATDDNITKVKPKRKKRNPNSTSIGRSADWGWTEPANDDDDDFVETVDDRPASAHTTRRMKRPEDATTRRVKKNPAEVGDFRIVTSHHTGRIELHELDVMGWTYEGHYDSIDDAKQRAKEIDPESRVFVQKTLQLNPLMAPVPQELHPWWRARVKFYRKGWGQRALAKYDARPPTQTNPGVDLSAYDDDGAGYAGIEDSIADSVKVKKSKKARKRG